MKIKLKQLLNASDLEFINGYEVENYNYKGGFDGAVELTASGVEDLVYEVDQQQDVELSQEGYAKVLTTAGESITMRFKVVRTLTPSDFS